jgi:hypothetical protein
MGDWRLEVGFGGWEELAGVATSIPINSHVLFFFIFACFMFHISKIYQA